jgi:glycosyl transferase family 25
VSALAAYFDRAYVINLPERRDRLEEMREQLGRVGLRLGEGNVALFPAVRPADKGAFETTGARGCFLSHLAVLQDAANSSCARVAIFEDDLNFSRDFNQRIGSLLEGLARAPWSMFYGGHRLPMTSPAGLYRLPAATEMLTAHFVAFQGPAIARVANLLRAMAGRPSGDPRGGAMHVDGAYNWYRRQHPADLALAAIPQLGYQRSSRTDVHGLGWMDKTPLVRQSIARLRRLRNRAAVR